MCLADHLINRIAGLPPWNQAEETASAGWLRAAGTRPLRIAQTCHVRTLTAGPAPWLNIRNHTRSQGDREELSERECRKDPDFHSWDPCVMALVEAIGRSFLSFLVGAP